MRQEPDLDIKISIASYWNWRGDTYDKFPVSGSAEKERVAYKITLSRVFNGNKLNILDVGTGTGFLALILAEMGHELAGLDLAEGMMKEAKKNAKEAGHSIRFDLGDAENLPFEDESFDAVICRHLLWTLPSPWKALREWKRVTRPGGQVVAIEGEWRDASLTSRLKRLVKQLGILVYERANPWRLGYKKEVDKMLPFRDGLAPEKAAELFQDVGLANVSVQDLEEIRNIQKDEMPLLYSMALPTPPFLIKGERIRG